MENYEICLKIHSIRVKVNTNYRPYAQYLRSYFDKIIIPASPGGYEIESIAHWQQDFWGNNPPRLNEGCFSDFESIGASTLLKGQRLIKLEKINKRKFRFDFSLDGKTLNVKAVYQHRTLRQALQKLSGKVNDMLFSDFTYYFIYYPVFWYLENFQQIFVLHAASVAIKDSIFVFCGLENMGKTTLSLAALKDSDSIFISDNLVFYDSNNIFACHQPIKLRPNQERKFPHLAMKKLREFKLKTFYELSGPESPTAKLSFVFLLMRFARDPYLQEINKDEFVHLVYNTNFLVWELENYEHFARLLNLIGRNVSLKDLRLSAFRELTQRSRCYLFGIGRDETIDQALFRIRSLLN